MVFCAWVLTDITLTLYTLGTSQKYFHVYGKGRHDSLSIQLRSYDDEPVILD